MLLQTAQPAQFVYEVVFDARDDTVTINPSAHKLARGKRSLRRMFGKRKPFFLGKSHLEDARA